MNRLKAIAQTFKLKLEIDEPIQHDEPVEAILDLLAEPRTMRILTRQTFAEEQKFHWADDIVGLPPPTDPEESAALEQAHTCLKGFLRTSAGLALINLELVNEGDYVTNYAGELFLDYTRSTDFACFRLLPFVTQKEVNELEAGSAKYELAAKSVHTVGQVVLNQMISGSRYRNYGGYFQHLYTFNELEQIFQSTEETKKVATENLQIVEFATRVCYKARKKLPPFTLLGWSYGPEYWVGQPADPFLFDKRGNRIDHLLKAKQVALFVRDQRFRDTVTVYKSREELKSIPKKAVVAWERVALNASHLQHFYDQQKSCYRFPRIYNKITVADLKADDYLQAGKDLYTTFTDPADRSPRELPILQDIESFYQKANNLYCQETPLPKKKIQDCLKSIGSIKDLNHQLIKLHAQEQKKKSQLLPDPTQSNTGTQRHPGDLNNVF